MNDVSFEDLDKARKFFWEYMVRTTLSEKESSEVYMLE